MVLVFLAYYKRKENIIFSYEFNYVLKCLSCFMACSLKAKSANQLFVPYNVYLFNLQLL